MLNHVLIEIICETFEKIFGRGQAYRVTSQAMHMSFNLSLDKKEEGFRYLELLLYAHQDYVSVYVKETWHVRLLIPSSEYRKGSTQWQLVAHHNSCWREDGVVAVINANQDRIISVFDPWYTAFEMDKEKLLNEFHYTSRTETVPENHWVHKRDVFFFET